MQPSKTPYQLLLWAATREAARARHRNDARTMVTMIGEIEHERYSTLPLLLSLLLLHYQSRVGEPPASQQQDLAMGATKKRRFGANPHPTRARDTRRRP